MPIDDFYDTYKLNYGYWCGQGLYGIPFDCDIQMVHFRPKYFKEVTGGSIDTKNTIKTYDDLLKFSGELNKVDKGVAGVGFMGARGFWSTYTWEHVAAQYGVDLFDDKWEPVFNGDAGVKALEMIIALQKNGPNRRRRLGLGGRPRGLARRPARLEHLLAGFRDPGDPSGPEQDRGRRAHDLRAAGRRRPVRAAEHRRLDLGRDRDPRRTPRVPS